MLFVILFFLGVLSIALLVYRKDQPAVLVLGLSISAIIMLVGIIIYTAKTGGLSRSQKVFLFLSTDIQRKLAYMVFPLSKLGYMIAVGRYLFPGFLLLLAANYSMIPLIRRMQKYWWVIFAFPAISLVIYYPNVFYQLVRNRFAFQKFIMGATASWIALYVLISLALFLYEYLSITIHYCRKQFRYIITSIGCLTFLYSLYAFQDPIQAYQIYTAEYLWVNGLSYANPSLSMSAWVFITLITILFLIMGFWHLKSYSQVKAIENMQEVALQRKFDTASMGASVFVHSIKNQLLSANVVHKKMQQELNCAVPDMDKMKQYCDLLHSMNDSMLGRMDELYRSVKSNGISLRQVDADVIVGRALQRFEQKYPEVAISVDIQTRAAILADESHLGEALYNLLTNAQEAVVASGKPQEKDSVQLIVHDERLYIVFEVQDKGCGLTKQELKKIFDPFYTSKNTNYNWGMGLYYVQQIIKSHLGTLRVESIKGEGTQFFAMLPRYAPRTASYWWKAKNHDQSNKGGTT